MSLLENFFRAQGASGALTFAICTVILFISYLGFVHRRRAFLVRKPVGELTRLAPAGTISLGIFGTFLGIYVGLLNFNTSDINSSIPELLGGLKTAFATSLVGMLSSLVLRYQFGHYENRELSRDEAASSEPVELLRQAVSGISSLGNTVDTIGEAVVKCFRSDEEYSLVSQLKLIRTDMSDLRKDVTKSLDEFGEKVAQLGTEAMIKALREVIEDFNSKLNDLVGAEFKQLKESMVKLVEWQENHRQAVDQMQRQLTDYLTQVRSSVQLLERTSTAIASASEHLDSVDSSLSAISVSADDITTHLEALKAENAQLAELLTQVRTLGEEAKTVLPAVSAHINEATLALSDAAEGARSDLKEASQELANMVTGVSKEIAESASAHSRQVEHSLEEISSGLEKTLEDSLVSLAGQLAALSNKFVEDYTPLTDRLREVVSLASHDDHANVRA